MPGKSSKPCFLDDIGDQWAPIGSRPWCRWFLGQAKLHRESLENDVTHLKDVIKSLQKYEAWKALGFASFESLCCAELDLDESEINAILTARKGMALGSVIARANAAKPLKAQGRPEGNAKKGDIITFSSRGTDPDYLTARIARDRPDILERMKSGEFASVRKAAIEAGIVKVKTPLQQIEGMLGKLAPAELRHLIVIANEMLGARK